MPSTVDIVFERVEGFLGIHRAVNDDVAAAKAGMKSQCIPLLDDTAETVAGKRDSRSAAAKQTQMNTQMKTFLDFVTAKENQPCYVHCEAGKGRTGLAVAVYRMAAQGWPPEKALDEAKKMGLGFDDQRDFILQFAADLKAGKIAGYPLNPPVPTTT